MTLPRWFFSQRRYCSEVVNFSSATYPVRHVSDQRHGCFFFDFVWKLRQVASASRSLFVDAEDLVSVPHATETILFAIDVFH